jgi:hypothetical protein
VIEVIVIAGSTCAAVGLVLHTYGLARERDRTPVLWSGLALAVSVIAAVVTLRALSGIVYSGPSLVALTFAALAGPSLAPAMVALILRRLPAGRPRVRKPVPVRLMGERGDVGALHVGEDGLRFEAGWATRHVPPSDLGRVIADGECLIVGVRSSGEELRWNIVGFPDPWRRRRICAALAAALTGGVPRATAREVE